MKKVEGFYLKELAEEYILVPYGKKTEEVGEVYTLSETAAFIYEQIDIGCSIAELIRKVSEAYQVSEEMVAEDVQEVLRFMIAKGIVEN